jgi:hypothetical protein
MKSRPNHRIYIDALRGMSGEDRLRKAFELTGLSRELLLAGLRRRHPEMPEEKLRELYLHRLRRSWDRRD